MRWTELATTRRFYLEIVTFSEILDSMNRCKDEKTSYTNLTSHWHDMNTERRETVPKTSYSLLHINVARNTPMYKTLLDAAFRLPRTLLNLRLWYQVCNTLIFWTGMLHGAHDPEGPQANPWLISVPVYCIKYLIIWKHKLKGHKVQQ